MCIGCGSCVIVCPNKAIQMYHDKSKGIFIPMISQEKCINCKLCIEVCFGCNFDHQYSSVFINFLKKTFGTFRNTYIGASNNSYFRFFGSSGGIIPSILEYLFENTLIECAIGTKMIYGRFPFGKTIIIQDKTEIPQILGSKYCPVLISDTLDLLEENKRYAFIGTPCQIFSIKKLISLKKIRGDVKYFIGILCGGVPNYLGTKFLSYYFKIPYHNIKELHYRGRGWPGRLYINYGSQIFQKSFLNYWPIISPWFVLKRCEICISGLNILADISCGDAWFPELLRVDNKGTSVIATRTEIGDEIFDRMISNGKINYRKIEVMDFLNSQRSMIDYKNKTIIVKLSSFFRRRYHNLVFKEDIILNNQIPFKNILIEFILRFIKFFAQNEKRWPLFKIFLSFYRKIPINKINTGEIK